jgi:hypothetical protein
MRGGARNGKFLPKRSDFGAQYGEDGVLTEEGGNPMCEFETSGYKKTFEQVSKEEDITKAEWNDFSGGSFQ